MESVGVAVADGGLEDLELSEEERDAEVSVEAEKDAKRRDRRARMDGFSDDELREVLEDPSNSLDESVARELLTERERGDVAADAAAERERLEALEAEAGPAVGDMPSGEPETALAPDKIILKGTAEQRDWGGKAPQTTILNVQGMKFEVEGAFRRGEIIKFEGSMRLVGEGVKDKLDKTTMTPMEAREEFSAVVLDMELDTE